MVQMHKGRTRRTRARRGSRAGAGKKGAAAANAGAGRRSYRRATTSLESMHERLGVDGSVLRRATEIYDIVTEKNLVRGRSITALAASAYYAACREAGAQVTLKDMQQASDTTRKDITRCYRLMLRELDIRMPVVDAASCIARIAQDAGLSGRTESEAVRILQDAEASKISAGKDPMGLAAAALYLASSRFGEGRTQKMIADAADVTEVTIRNRYKGLVIALGDEDGSDA